MRIGSQVAILVAAALVATGCVTRSTPSAATEPTILSDPSPSTPSQRPPERSPAVCGDVQPSETGVTYFDGTCQGWRVASVSVAIAEGLERSLDPGCDPQLFGSSLETTGPPPDGHPTDIDIEFARVPVGAKIKHVAKWACGARGLSDNLILRFDGGGDVDVARFHSATRLFEIDALDGSVSECTVLNKPAICVDSFGDAYPFEYALAAVLVIEDGTLDPTARVLRLYSEDASLDQLMTIAQSVVRN
jgi:hypothetical protein